jgi:hypothetical protein
MKMLRCVLYAVVIASCSSTSHAAVFAVSGFLDDVVLGLGPSAPPSLSIKVATDPVRPTFTSFWTIDTGTASFAGNLDFAPFTSFTTVYANGNVVGSGQSYNPHTVHSIDTSNAIFTYDAVSRTLSLTHATTLRGGEPIVCTATGAVRCGVPPDNLPPPPAPIDFSLSLIFDPTFSTFTGTAQNISGSAATGLTMVNYSFSGTEVPVPAAAWLFGSCLLGLVGAGRRRRL